MKTKVTRFLITSLFGSCILCAVPSLQAQALPSPWQTQDIGAVAATGTANYSNGTFTIEGSGADIFGTADEFRYVYQAATGDCEITARVTTIENTNTWAKGGVMIRETLNANSTTAQMLCQFNGVLAFQRRTSTGGTTASTNGSTVALPYWVRIKRVGSTFSAYSSANGTTWTQVGANVTISMTSGVYIGLPVTSHNDGVLCTITIDSVTVIGGSTGAPEINVKGNAVTIADGDTTPSTTDHTDFGGVDVTSGTVTRTFTIENTGTAALTVGTVTLSGTNAADFSVTTQPAASVAAAGSTTFQITFDPSATGTRSASLSFSNDDADENPYNFSIQGTGTSAGGLPSPWQTQDIGAVAAAGTASYSTGTFTIEGSGADIFGTVDEFRYVYQAATGDCEVTTRVVSIENTNTWAKGGVMIRETLNADSKTAQMLHQFNQVLSFQRRTSTGGTTDATNGSTVASPYWVRIKRVGSTFSAYSSANGTTWTQVGANVTISMTSSVYIGLPVTSHNDGVLCTIVFDNVTATGGSGGVPEVNVKGNGVTIADGDTTPSTTDHTDFGSVAVSSGTVTRTFTVENTGAAALTVDTVSLSGTHAADFAVTVQPASSVAAGGNTTYQVRFDPSATGTRSASTSFGNNDADENPYDFSIQGTGTTVGPIEAIDSTVKQVAISVGTAARQSWIGFGWGANGREPAKTAFPQVQTHIAKLTTDINATVIRFFTPKESALFLDAYKPYWDLVKLHGIDTVFTSGFMYRADPDTTPAQEAQGVLEVKNGGVPIHFSTLQNEPDGNPGNAVTGGTSVYASTQQAYRDELNARGLQSTRIVSLEWRHPTVGGVEEFDVLNAAGKISPTGPVDMGALHIYDKSPDNVLYDNKYLTKNVGLISTETGNNGSPNCQARFLSGVNHGTRIELVHIGLISTSTPNSEQLAQGLLEWNGTKRPWYGACQIISQNLVRGTVMRLCQSNDTTAELTTVAETRMIRHPPSCSGFNPRHNVIAGPRADGKWVVAAVNTTYGVNEPSPYTGGHYAALKQQLTVTIPELVGQALTFSAKRADINGAVTGPATVNMQDGVVRFTLAPGETIAMTAN